MGLLVKHIKSKEGVTHFKRWRLLATPWLNIYVHGIYCEDKEANMHNHPWNFLSVVLKGGFTEQTHDGFTERTFLKFKYSKAEKFHRIFALHYKRPCYTLVFTGPVVNEPWGYDTTPFTDHEAYRRKKNY